MSGVVGGSQSCACWAQAPGLLRCGVWRAHLVPCAGRPQQPAESIDTIILISAEVQALGAWGQGGQARSNAVWVRAHGKCCRLPALNAVACACRTGAGGARRRAQGRVVGEGGGTRGNGPPAQAGGGEGKGLVGLPLPLPLPPLLLSSQALAGSTDTTRAVSQWRHTHQVAVRPAVELQAGGAGERYHRMLSRLTLVPYACDMLQGHPQRPKPQDAAGSQPRPSDTPPGMEARAERGGGSTRTRTPHGQAARHDAW